MKAHDVLPDDLPVPKKAAVPEWIANVHALRMQGFSYREIGKQIGQDPTTVWRCYKFSGMADMLDSKEMLEKLQSRAFDIAISALNKTDEAIESGEIQSHQLAIVAGIATDKVAVIERAKLREQAPVTGVEAVLAKLASMGGGELKLSVEPSHRTIEAELVSDDDG